MQINSLGSQAVQMPQFNKSAFSKVKENFENLGTALESGNLSDAKSALAELQKSAPKGPANRNNPMSSKMDALSKAVESGDLEAAKKAYAEIQSALSQRPAMRPGGGGGPPPSGKPMASGVSGSSDAASAETFDVKDLNRDGNVSAREELEYSQRQLESENQKNRTDTSSSRTFNVLA